MLIYKDKPHKKRHFSPIIVQKPLHKKIFTVQSAERNKNSAKRVLISPTHPHNPANRLHKLRGNANIEHNLSLSYLAIALWALSHNLFELTRKIIAIGEARLFGDISNTQSGVR